MEKKLCSISKLSLKEISLRRVAVILCSQTNVITLLHKFSVSDTVKENLIIRLSKLGLPSLLTEQMKYLIKPIVIEIREWIKFHEEYLYELMGSRIDAQIFEKLCWTVLGSIDYRKTAENIILHKLLHLVERYRIACLYCLDNYIPVLWEQLPEVYKTFFYKKEGPLHISTPRLEFCWPYILQGEKSKLDFMSKVFVGDTTTFNQYGFKYSACQGNKAATEYFFQELPFEETEDLLLRTARQVVKHRIGQNRVGWFPKKQITEVLCYLLSQMSSEMQMEVFKDQPCIFLSCFLDWPWQHLFLDIAELIWTFLPENDFDYLLRTINLSIICSDYYFPKLFQDFFLQSPSKFRKQFVNTQCDPGLFFRHFFNFKDSETIKVVFRNIDYEDRKALIFGRRFFDFFCQSMSKGDWHFVELCLQEATLSSEDRMKFKEKLSRFFPMDELSVVVRNLQL